jgi:hypothetical protein
MIPVHVHDDRSIAIDAPAGKVREILIRYRECTECPAFCRRKTNALDPLIEAPIT